MIDFADRWIYIKNTIDLDSSIKKNWSDLGWDHRSKFRDRTATLIHIYQRDGALMLVCQTARRRLHRRTLDELLYRKQLCALQALGGNLIDHNAHTFPCNHLPCIQFGNFNLLSEQNIFLEFISKCFWQKLPLIPFHPPLDHSR